MKILNMTRKFIFIVISLFCILIGLYPFIYYVILQQEFSLLSGKPDFIKSSFVWKIGFYTHIFFGGLALLLGWTQFVKKIRQRNLKLHRQLGKVYVLSAFLSSVASIGIGFFSTGGMIAAAGFVSLGFVWFFSTFKAYTSILSGDVARHEMWVIYSFSACFAAVTLRLWTPVLALVFEEYITGYRIVAWLSWVPNMVVAGVIVMVKRMKKPSLKMV